MSIEVHVRIRPHVPNGVWSCAETVLYSTHNPNTRYVYNKVHHIGTSNQSIFQSIEALVHAGFDGKNVTVMAYGQTGSGKTHSMNGTEADLGLVPRTAKFLLDLRKNAPGTEIVVYFTEIYNESVKDLLEPQRGELALHDAADGGVYFEKKSVPMETLDDFAKLQSVAERNRKYGVTNLNDHSSRSHMILTFEIHRSKQQVSSINLVDLAGSESASRANTEGVSLREGGFINKSLLTLGNVVDAIVEKRSHVPYRDAKLTRMLRNCLGGSGMTFILCCINPSPDNFEQTVASLRFTQRAMKIKNDPVMLINMPPLFTHQYNASAEELVHSFRELSNVLYQRGLRDAFMYTNNTISSVVSHFDGQVSESLHAMANAQRLLIAHDHAMAVDQLGRLYSQLHEMSRQHMQSCEIAEHERKRQREAVEEIESRKEKITRLEFQLQKQEAESETELAGWEYQLYEARQRRVTKLQLLLVSERSGRCRVQYEWSVCVERIAARCVPAIKSMCPITPPVADKRVVLRQMQQRLQKAREELVELTVAHSMIEDDLLKLQEAEEENPSICVSSSVVSLSPQPNIEGIAIDVDATDADIEQRIQELEKEEKLLMSRAIHAARCESSRRIRESLIQHRSRTPPTSRPAVCHYASPILQQHEEEEEQNFVLLGESTAHTRNGTECYVSPKQRSLTPRTARTIFPTADVCSEVEKYTQMESKDLSPQETHLAEGVRRALGVLRDVRSKLMRPAQRRQQRADAVFAAASTPFRSETSRSGSCHRRRTKSCPLQEEDITLSEVYMQKGHEKEKEPIVGIAARRRMEGAPIRPNVERALWRMSQSPISNSVEKGQRARSRRR